MNKEQFAELLHRREYRSEITRDEEEFARANDLLVCYGNSDDLFEVTGIVYDEFGSWEGGDFFVVKKIDGSIDVIDTDSYEQLQILPNRRGEVVPSVKITAEWCPRDLDCSWRISTQIPHSTFDILENGELYCRGIVVEKGDIERALSVKEL